MGSRFNSSIRSKDHLRPKKIDGPGPGSYKLPSGLKTGKRTVSSHDSFKTTTFGNAKRGFVENNANPGPDRYDVNKFTEAAYTYSFPKGNRGELNKNNDVPGPDQYYRQ